jgi:Pectate lyase superfamily protein
MALGLAGPLNSPREHDQSGRDGAEVALDPAWNLTGRGDSLLYRRSNILSRIRRSLGFGGVVATMVTVMAVGVPTQAASAATPQLAIAFAEASQDPGGWSAPSPYTLAVNWDGSTGARPVAVAYAAVPSTAGTTIVGPTITNLQTQYATGGSLLLVSGPSVSVHGITPADYVHGVTGGSSVAIPAPAGLQTGDLVAVYIDTPNTMVAPAGWTLRRHDAEGTVWTHTMTSAASNLGNWSTTGDHGWTYTALALGAVGASPVIDGQGGAGAETSSAVKTGSATISGSVTASPTATATTSTSPSLSTATATPTSTATVKPTSTTVPATATPVSTATVKPTSTTVPATATPVSTATAVPTTTTTAISGTYSSGDPVGENRCQNTALASVNVKTDYGAQGNGVANDSTAFKNAIATGKVVHVPAGTYILSQIDLSANQVVVLCGAGKGTTTLVEAASPTQTQAMFSQFDYSGGGHLGYLEIQDMTLDGNKANVLRRPQGSSMMNYGIVHVMVRKMLIANDEIRNGYHGLRILDVADQTNGTPGEAIIRDNWFHGMALEAGFTGGTTHNIHLSKYWPSHSVIWVDRNNIEECGSGSGSTCTLPSQTAGQSSGGLLYIPDGGAPGGPPQQVLRIKDNTFRNVGMNMVGTDEPEAEIYLYQQADNAQIIHNNLINSYYEGVAVFSSNNVEMAYNIADGNGVPVPVSANYSHMEYYAIDAFSRRTNFPTYVNSSGWNIHDNVVKNSTWYKKGVCACFAVDSAGNGTGSNIKIDNNTFTNNLNDFDGTRTTPIATEGAVSVTESGNNTTAN